MRLEYEHIQQGRKGSFFCSTFRDKTFLRPYHIHDEDEILLITQGKGRIVVGDYSGRFEPGDLFLFGSNLPHTFFSDPPQEGDESEVESHYIQFKENCFGPDFFNCNELKEIKVLLKSSTRGLLFHGFNYSRMKEIFCSMEDLSPLKRISGFMEILDILETSEEKKALATEQYIRESSHYEIDRLNRVLDLIHRRFTGILNLEEAAETASLSAAAFSRFFKKCMGQSFIDYLIELRLSEACRLLLETDLPITHISTESGFNNISNFNRQFLKRKGESPRDFRGKLYKDNL